MSESWQQDVEDFHRALDIDVGDHRSPRISRPELRAALIMEEAAETVNAITGMSVEYRIGNLEKSSSKVEETEPSLVEAIDGMVDVIVVVLGTAVEFGIDLQPFWDEVHRTNMNKRGGPVREDGKRLKPEGWQPPDIMHVLATEIMHASKVH